MSDYGQGGSDMRHALEHSALLLVDIQHDFMPGGALAVPRGDEIITPVTDLMSSDQFDVLVATQDWHPPGHASFASSHAGRAPFETIDLYGHDQTLWPDHCVQGSRGARLHPSLLWQRVSAIVRKGMDPRVDSYSAFRNNWDENGARPATGLAGYLRERGVRDVFLCGLARDYCVKWSAQDAAQAGFGVWLLWDATRAIETADDETVRGDLTAKGVHIISSAQTLEVR